MEFPFKKLLEWYRQNKRDLPWRKTKDIYAVWVSEVMLQQTQVAAVIPYYCRFLERFPTVNHLAGASEQEVLKVWEGMGYYSRARNLHRAAKEVVSRYSGSIPGTPRAFRGLPGVGAYIEAAVLSITRNIAAPVVDGNVMRVYTRFRGIGDDIRIGTVRTRIFNELQQIIPAEAPGDFNQALMELGALICSPAAPRCTSCPLKKECAAFTTQTIDRYPFKSSRAHVPEYNVSIGIILKGDKFYIQKRPSRGHLGGLWEFPGGKSRQEETAEQTLYRECKEELGLKSGIIIIKKLTVVHHGYSHFKIHMSVFVCRLEREDEEIRQPEGHPFCWITVNELDNYPFPGANHKFFPALRKFLK